MVCSRGESLTTHRNQMNLKLKTLLTAGLAAALGASFAAATPADARNGWILTTEQHSYRVFDKLISRSGNIVTYDHQYVKDIGESTRHIQQTNCSAWTRRTKFDFGWSNWSEILPETVADYTARAMCG